MIYYFTVQFLFFLINIKSQITKNLNTNLKINYLLSTFNFFSITKLKELFKFFKVFKNHRI